MHEKTLENSRSPLVSIFIPVWNGADLISKAIKSCLYQTYDNIEIIIIDDMSTDNTKEIVDEYRIKDKRVKYFRNQKNLGFLGNYLNSLQFLSGEYIQLVCHDDWLSKNYIEEGIKNFNLYPNAIGVFGKSVGLRLVNEKICVVSEFGFDSRAYPIQFVLKHFFWQNWGAAFFSLLKRDCIDIAMLKSFYAEISKDPLYGHLYSKGVGSDYFILLNVFKKFESSEIVFTETSYYFNLLRPMSTGFFVNSEFGKPLDIIRHNKALLNGYLYIYNNEFKKYRFGIKMFIGANIINYLFNSIKKMFVPDPITRTKLTNVLEFFDSNYSFLEKFAVLLYAIKLAYTRLWKFLKRKLFKTRNLEISFDV